MWFDSVVVAVHVAEAAEVAAAQVMNGGKALAEEAQVGNEKADAGQEGGDGFAVEPPGVTQGIDTLASVACRPAVRDAVVQGARYVI